MTLKQYIKEHGTSHIADKLGITPAAVRVWHRMDGAPSPLMAQKLITMSKKALTWQSIYAPFVRKQKRQRKG